MTPSPVINIYDLIYCKPQSNLFTKFGTFCSLYLVKINLKFSKIKIALKAIYGFLKLWYLI